MQSLLLGFLLALFTPLALAAPTSSGLVTNEDGSVTINHPRFHYNGHDTPIALSINPDFPGACRLFKFDKMVGYTVVEIEKLGAVAVVLNTKGKIRGVRVQSGNYYDFDKFNVYQSITCSN